MEPREILIANTKTQLRTKLTTDATTLAELKAAMKTAGIDYSGMTFTEGISKTQLLNDDTQLPQNIMYKGNQTNNLVILLTNTKKNIASGLTGTRNEAKEYLANTEGLKDEVKRITGKNWTIVPNDVLWEIITNFCTKDEETENSNPECDKKEDCYNNNHTEDYDDDNYDDEEDCDDDDYDDEDENSDTLVAIIVKQIKKLLEIKALSVTDIQTLAFQLSNIASNAKPASPQSLGVNSSDGTITDDDIDDMIDDLI